MRKHNLAFIDIETTGFFQSKHEIIEIGGVVVSQNNEPGKPTTYEIIEEFDIKIKPERISDADPQSLRINGYDPANWVFAYTLKEGMQILAKKTEGAIMVAHNLCFDYGFIEKAFIDSVIDNKMHYLKLDTISFAYARLYHNQDVEKFSLRALCEYFKIENKNSHTALSDARATFELYKKLTEL